MHSFVVSADTFDVIQAQGPDVVRFLQGQLTCDVAALPANSQIYGACCNNKGRVIAGFTLVRVEAIYYLCMARGLGALLIDALRKYLPFYKCELILAATGHQLLAVAGVHAEQMEKFAGLHTLAAGSALAQDSGWLCKLEGAGARGLWWCNHSQSDIKTIVNELPAGTLEQWECLGLLAGHYPLRQADCGVFTPQELNYDQNGYISFSKGCYTGQEIVARMHYRGKPKKQLYLVKLAQAVTADMLDQQHDVTDRQNQSLGHCRLTRSDGNLHLALIELATDYAGDFGALRLAQVPVVAGCAFESKVIQFSHFS